MTEIGKGNENSILDGADYVQGVYNAHLRPMQTTWKHSTQDFRIFGSTLNFHTRSRKQLYQDTRISVWTHPQVKLSFNGLIQMGSSSKIKQFIQRAVLLQPVLSSLAATLVPGWKWTTTTLHFDCKRVQACNICHLYFV